MRHIDNPEIIPPSKSSEFEAAAEKRRVNGSYWAEHESVNSGRCPPPMHENEAHLPSEALAFPWVKVLIMLTLLWSWLLYCNDIQWLQVCVGFSTGMTLMAWAIEITDNKVPASWRRQPPRSL